jgi:hypothetical protein
MIISTPNPTSTPTVSLAIENISKDISQSIARISEMAELKQKRSASQYRWDVVLRAITAILAVASPALVTYATTASVGDAYKFAAILLSAIAGASATLQTIFTLQENHVRDGIDALDLREIKTQLESDRESANRKEPDYERYSALQVAHSTATASLKEIIVKRLRRHLETKLEK